MDKKQNIAEDKKEIINKIKLPVNIHIPHVPYILFGDYNAVHPISDFTIKELQAIGREWTAQLIRKATEIKNKPKKVIKRRKL